MRIERRPFLDVDFDTLRIEDLLARISTCEADTPFQYVVTPNVDHVIRLHNRLDEFPALPAMYRDADFCICDSQVLSLLAKWKGVDLPVTVGTDLAEAVLERVARKGDRIALIGANRALFQALQAKYTDFSFVQHIPPMGLTKNPAARREAAEFIKNQSARFTFICVGSPQQEMIASEASKLEGSHGIAFCVGAALEFITDQQTRAPAIFRRLRLEWAHRLMTNPRRLWRRYLVEGPAIFLLTYRWRKRVA